LVAAAESTLGVRRPARFGRRAALAVAAIVVAIAASLVVAFVVRGGRGPAAPRAHDNALVRIDPRTNAVQRVIDVRRQPMAVAASGRTVWVYSHAAGVVSEVEAQTNRILHTTRISVTPVDLRRVTGPVLAADANGAWIVGVDRRGRSLLTRVLTGGERRDYVLRRRPEAVATGLGAVWVLGGGAHDDRLFRLDPATGTTTVRARFPASSRVDSLTVGFRDVWVVSSSTATLYRVNPRLAAVDRVDLGKTAGQAQRRIRPGLGRALRRPRRRHGARRPADADVVFRRLLRGRRQHRRVRLGLGVRRLEWRGSALEPVDVRPLPRRPGHRRAALRRQLPDLPRRGSRRCLADAAPAVNYACNF
jgi:hypothetical protein